MTDRTPIQFGDDDRQLLRQIAGLVQEIHFSQSALEEKVTGLEARIVGLEAKVDERLYDTRPMWEQLNSRLDRMETEFNSFKAEIVGFKAEVSNRLDRIETRLVEMKDDIRDMDRSLLHVQRDVARRIGD